MKKHKHKQKPSQKSEKLSFSDKAWQYYKIAQMAGFLKEAVQYIADNLEDWIENIEDWID